MKNSEIKSVDEYIANAAPLAKEKLIEMRKIIKELAPDAEERISYQMPGYFLNGPLVYIGAFKDHVSLFGTASRVVDKYKDEMKELKTSKGTIQFPLDKPLPTSLISKIVRDRVKENKAK